MRRHGMDIAQSGDTDGVTGDETALQDVFTLHYRCLHINTGKEFSRITVAPVYDLLLAAHKRRLRFTEHLLRLPTG